LPGGGISHHFAFSQIPLLSAALIACVENVKLLKRLSFIFFGVSAIAIFISVTSVKIDSVSHEIGIVQAVAVKAANSDTVISYSSWGGYMQYSLKNENEIPILNLNNETDFPKIEKYASTNDKEILNICMDCTIELMQNYFKNSAITQIPTSTKVWKVYKVVPNRLDNPE
jgi:hypothetical protein